MKLESYKTGGYSPGRQLFTQLAWWYVGEPLVRSGLLPFSPLKVALLKLFGARIGRGVRVKPGVRIKFPWRLEVGDHSWIGERVWIDNLATVSIGSNCCVSQGAYFCTGNHRWDSPQFELVTGPIHLADHVWIAAQAIVGPGITVGEGAVLTLGSVATMPLEPWSICSGNPARKTAERRRS